MSITSEILLDELKIALSDYANHIDFFVQRIASNDNIKIYNSYHNSVNNESLCVQAMIYKIYQDYSKKLIDFASPIPDTPQIVNTEDIIKKINKKGITRFIKQNDLNFTFSSLLLRANPGTKSLPCFKDKKFMQNSIRKREINLIKRWIQIDKDLLENFEKGTWKATRDKLKTLDSLKF